MLLVIVGMADVHSVVWAQSYSERKMHERAIRQLEAALEVRGDKAGSSTWYVLVFFDQAQRISQRHFKSTPTYDLYHIIGESYGVKDVRLVQGRRQAAEAVLQYLSSANTALQNMPPLNSPNRYVFGKYWVFHPFATEAEARSVHEKLTPKSASAASSR
jgi:hypothetical protein